MNREIISYYSHNLTRNINVAIFGHAGLPILGFPTQNSMCLNYEDFGLINEISDYIDGGQIQLFVPDTVDIDSWSNEGGDLDYRTNLQENYHRFIVNELYDFMRSRNSQTPIVTGLSMGANHAFITFMRRPELFAGVLAFSGVYDSDYFFHGEMNGILYDNSPERFLENMPKDHPYIKLYNERRIILCVGQGAWEEDGVRTLANIQRIFAEKGINAWCDFWGSDVNHDWPWWFKQMRYFLPYFLNDVR